MIIVGFGLIYVAELLLQTYRAPTVPPLGGIVCWLLPSHLPWTTTRLIWAVLTLHAAFSCVHRNERRFSYRFCIRHRNYRGQRFIVYTQQRRIWNANFSLPLDAFDRHIATTKRPVCIDVQHSHGGWFVAWYNDMQHRQLTQLTQLVYAHAPQHPVHFTFDAMQPHTLLHVLRAMRLRDHNDSITVPLHTDHIACNELHGLVCTEHPDHKHFHFDHHAFLLK